MSKKIKITQPEWVRQQMEERIFREDGQAAQLAQSLYSRAVCFPQNRREAQDRVMECLFSCHDPEAVFGDALRLMFGEEEAGNLQEIFCLRRKGPAAETMFRTPFHSSCTADYLEGIFLPTVYRWVHGTGCPVTVRDCLTRTDLILPPEYDLANRLALELWRGEEDVCRAVEALFLQGEEEELPRLSRDIFLGILRSDHRLLMEQVKALLSDRLAPQSLKEELLSVLDQGTEGTFAELLHQIYEEKLYRSPSVSRMIDTWLWLGFGAWEPEAAREILKKVLEFLSHPQLCSEGMEDEHGLTVHLALWSTALGNRRTVAPIINNMLHSSRENRVISAISFLNTVEHRALPFPTTVELLTDTDSLDVLSWLTPNLLAESAAETLSISLPERQKTFSLLEGVVKKIGKGETERIGKPFPWTVKLLSPEPVMECMIRIAAIGSDRSMIRSLGRMMEYMTPKQRGIYYETLLDPMGFPEDYALLLHHKNDRSPKNRRLISERLQQAEQQRRC